MTEINPNLKHIVFHKTVVDVVRDPITNFWSDANGTLYAYRDSSSSMDHIDRCGVGWFSLADGNPLNPACTPHDYTYESPVYQAFHTRSEADQYLKSLLTQIPGVHYITPEVFKFLAREEGQHLWENKETNN